MKAPFPWFGGKSRVASEVWSRFGNVSNYVEPFFGSGAVLLARPHAPNIETINDKDGLVSNFWRAIKHDPEKTAHYADWPVNENDLHARHVWLVSQLESLVPMLEGDPDYFDPKIAGYWVWGCVAGLVAGFAAAMARGSRKAGCLLRVTGRAFTASVHTLATMAGVFTGWHQS